jgi:hypothetical protein
MLAVREDPFRFHRFLHLGIWFYRVNERAIKYILNYFIDAGFHPTRISSKDSLYQLERYDCIIGFHGPLEEGEEEFLRRRMKAMHRDPLPLISLSAMKSSISDNDDLELKKIAFRLGLLEKVTLLGYPLDSKGQFDGQENERYLASLIPNFEKVGFLIENPLATSFSEAFDEKALRRNWTASLVFAFRNEEEFNPLYAFYHSKEDCFMRFRRAGYFFYTGSGAIPPYAALKEVPFWNEHHLELSLLAIMAPPPAD